MYVKRLIEFAEAHPELFPVEGFQRKKIDWIVDIESDSHVVTFNEAEKQIREVPSVSRASEVKPTLIVDKPDYVFGYATNEKESARSQIRHQAYMALLGDYVSKKDDQDVKKLIEVLSEEIQIPSKMKMGDFITFRIRDEDFLHENDKIKQYFEEELAHIDHSQTASKSKCMFCGQEEPILDVHTISFNVNGERTKLISANKNAYESHGNTNSYSAPTCRSCEQKYGKALAYLLEKKAIEGGEKHVLTVGELSYVYWLHGDKSQGNIARAFQMLDDNNLQSMKAYFEQMFTGSKRNVDFDGLSILVLSANKGRLVVRDYFEDGANRIFERIDNFLKAQDVGNEHLYNVYVLASATYQKPKTQMKVGDIQQWFNWIFKGQPLSKRILVQLLRRIQVEGRMNKLHFAVLKSWLISQKNGRDWTVKLDVKNKNRAYIVGRVFALLEKVHGDARGSSNESLSNKYFGSMSSTPKTVFAVLMKNYQHHLAKIGARSKGAEVYYDKKMIELLANINEIPTIFTLDEQAEFTLGYYHEKESLWTKKEEE